MRKIEEDTCIYINRMFFFVLERLRKDSRDSYYMELGTTAIAGFSVGGELIWPSKLKLCGYIASPGADRGPIPQIACWHIM